VSRESLGQADERSADVLCARCSGQRFVLVRPAAAPDPTDYVCIRCRAVLAGRNVSDSLLSPERRAQLTEAAQARRKSP
jgi:DNA-directed RNA polymerase subunit RPC12/RpoP